MIDSDDEDGFDIVKFTSASVNTEGEWDVTPRAVSVFVISVWVTPSRCFRWSHHQHMMRVCICVAEYYKDVQLKITEIESLEQNFEELFFKSETRAADGSEGPKLHPALSGPLRLEARSVINEEREKLGKVIHTATNHMVSCLELYSKVPDRLINSAKPSTDVSQPDELLLQFNSLQHELDVVETQRLQLVRRIEATQRAIDDRNKGSVSAMREPLEQRQMELANEFQRFSKAMSLLRETDVFKNSTECVEMLDKYNCYELAARLSTPLGQ